MSGTEPSILWYDLETFGGDPAADPVAQVAWCRTDLALRPLAEPTSLFCRPPWFCLPDPEACLITRITPQQCVAQGVSQHHFTNQLLAELSQPETTSAGYNVIRFDDEFVRHLLWRELLDPCAREWQNGNQRFDLLDAVRMTYALRPEGILWPVRDDGLPSFKLEQLVLANQLPQPRAHDAASDVEATIALARLLQEAQPKLFAWTRRMADKQVVRELLRWDPATPVIHVSGRYSAERGCLAMVLPLGRHPRQANKVAVFDLDQDPQQWSDLDQQQLSERIFAPRTVQLERPGVKFVHVGRCPMLAPVSVLAASDTQRIGLNPERCQAHARQLDERPELKQRLLQALAQERDWDSDQPGDPESELYAGFVSPADRSRLLAVRAEPTAALPRFEDPRLAELAWRWVSRVTGEDNQGDRQRWQALAYARLSEGYRRQPPYAQWQQQLEQLMVDNQLDRQALGVLAQLKRWGQCASNEAGLTTDVSEEA